MKIGIWSSYYYHLSPEDAVREFKAHGYDYCELSDEHSRTLLARKDAKTVGAEFKSFCDELGFTIPQGHLFLGEKICNEKSRELIKKQLDLFLAVGVKSAVLHCDSLVREDGTKPSLSEAREKNCEALSDLLNHVKGTDIVICLENLISTDFVNHAEGLMYFIDYFKSENLGICLDTGHLNLRDKDQVAFIKRVGKHLKALHLNDNEGVGDQHLMPYGKGHVDFVSVIRETKALGYDGLYNLEIPGESKAPIEVLGYKLDYLKKVMAYLDEKSN
jgi:sugar phosphate isomerase/epimerase